MAKREEEEADQTDAGSKDPDGLLKAIAIVAMYHGRPELLAKVEECVRVTQVSALLSIMALFIPPPPPPPVSSSGSPLCIG